MSSDVYDVGRPLVTELTWKKVAQIIDKSTDHLHGRVEAVEDETRVWLENKYKSRIS